MGVEHHAGDGTGSVGGVRFRGRGLSRVRSAGVLKLQLMISHQDEVAIGTGETAHAIRIARDHVTIAHAVARLLDVAVGESGGKIENLLGVRHQGPAWLGDWVRYVFSLRALEHVGERCGRSDGRSDGERSAATRAC